MSTTTQIDPFEPFIWLYNLLTGSQLQTFGSQALYAFINFYARFAVFSLLLSIILLVVVVVYARRFSALSRSVVSKIANTDVVESTATDEIVENQKWKLIQEHINSEDASKWRLAILEADIMLADLLDTMHLPGESIGDKLKAIEMSEFTTIEAAWEAHKIRNAIAHQGSDFQLTQREAKRVINLYGSVFHEFEIA